MRAGSVVTATIRFLSSEQGPTAVEYAVMLMLILLVCITGIQLVGGWTSGSFQDSSGKLQQAMGSG